MAKTYPTTTDTTEEPTKIPANRARAGSWGRHILWVLIISTALAALALLGSYAFHTDDLSGQGGQTKTIQGAATFDEGDSPALAQPSE